MAGERTAVEIQLSFRNIRLLRREELGHGSFGFVCKAQCDQLICAAKVIYRVLRQAVAPDPGREHRQPNRRFQSEIDFLKHVHHPNIVQYLGTYEDPDSGDLVLLMELMDESLTHFLESSPGDIPYHTQVNLSYDIAQALAFLHDNGIIHRDLSSNNVLLLAGTRAKVTDFGMSKFTERNISMTLSPGTPAFMSPEALNQPPVYTEKLDNFSFGVLLVQIVTRKFPEPTERFEMQELMNMRTNQVIRAQVPVQEIERRRGHISLIQQDHPLLPMALDCLKDRDQKRPSSQELCGRLNTLKRSERHMVSSQQDPAHTIRELQAQNQQHQAEIRDKNDQIQAQNHQIQQKDQQITQLQALNLQNAQQMQLKDQQVNRLVTRLEQATNELASRERQLRSLNQQLTDNEQIIATLQQELIQRDRQVSEMREMLAAKDRENQTINNDRLSVQQLASPVGRLTTQRAQPSEGPINMRWESLPNAPTRMWAGSSGVIGDRVYIRPDGSQTIHEFNSSNKQWSKLPQHPINGFTIVNVENTLTTVRGGSLGGPYSNKLYSYENGKWIESLPPMPTTRRVPGAVYANNTLVVAGGLSGGNYLSTNRGDQLSTVEILNTTSRQWSSVSSLPFTASQPSICIHGDHIYIHPCYTFNNSDQHSVIKCSLTALVQSKPRSRVWERIASLPVRWSTLTSVNGHLIAVGGWDSKPTNNVYQYNETTDSWTVASRMSVARNWCLTALLPDNKLMVVGGYNNEARRSIEIATISQ